MTTVTRMRWWQVPEVVTLERDLFPDDAWSAEQFWQELGLDTRHYVVALDEGSVVGYAGLFALPPDSDVQTIAVRADRQGSGVGALLMAWLMDRAAGARCRQVMLEVRSDNARAVALYERFGFERISIRRRYYPDGGDADIMRARVGRASDRSGP